jgi:PPK2 family polyphosphate:nucleotide phosphotransferase
MFKAVPSPYLVPFDGSFRHRDAPTAPPRDAPDHKESKQRLEKRVADLDELQRKLYAEDRWAVLLVFQAMDAAGKDGTIRAVLSGVNPAGCQVFSFKQPSSEELEHDFLWRTAKRLPERGRIGVFNRSHYEEVLVVRVHPDFLGPQHLPAVPKDLDELWKHRFASIREHEEHLARAGTVVLKFWLNVSRDEQRRRFLDRIAEPDKNWKFSAADVAERKLWDRYMDGYEEALNATSRSWAPWYAVPADDKHFLRLTVAEIVVSALESLGLSYPNVGEAEKARFAEMRAMLEKE